MVNFRKQRQLKTNHKMFEIQKIPPEIEIFFIRARELLKELIHEYEKRHKEEKEVSLRAMSLTHEILERIRNALDHTMRKYWNKHIAIKISKNERKKINIYFPIRKSLKDFKDQLIKMKMKDLETNHKEMYDFLLNTHKNYKNLLAPLQEKSNEGKHEKLFKQALKYIHTFTIESEYANVSWIPQKLKGGSNDPNVNLKKLSPDDLHRMSNPYYDTQIKTSVDFRFKKDNSSALFLCECAISQANRIVNKMIQLT